jgi:hypothetical protein
MPLVDGLVCDDRHVFLGECESCIMLQYRFLLATYIVEHITMYDACTYLFDGLLGFIDVLLVS